MSSILSVLFPLPVILTVILLCRLIIDAMATQHDGKIKCHAGNGTEYNITIPLKEI